MDTDNVQAEPFRHPRPLRLAPASESWRGWIEDNCRNSIRLVEDDSAATLEIQAPKGQVATVMIEGLLACHERLGDYGTTMPGALFNSFFPEVRLSLKAKHDGLCRSWNPERSEWNVLLRDQFDGYFYLPRAIQIELTNRCNLECVMCHAHDKSGAHRPLTREMAYMDMDLYRKIIDEATAPEHPRQRVQGITLQAWGESLMHPHLLEAIAYARSKGIEQIGMISNGTLIERKIGVRDLYRAGLTKLTISLDALDAETYKKIRVRDLFADAERAARSAARFAVGVRVRRIIAARLGMKPPLPFDFCVSLAHQKANEGQVNEFIRRWTPWTTTVQIHPVYDNFNYQNIYFKPEIPRAACIALWQNMLIQATGAVTVCCADYDGRHSVGSVGGSVSLRDVWTSPSYWRFRDDHTLSDGSGTDICAVCIGSGATDRRTGEIADHPTVFMPQTANVYRRNTFWIRALRRILKRSPGDDAISTFPLE